MILHAISQAERFIYMEDQYLVSMEISDALKAALCRLKHLTILIPQYTDLPQAGLRRRLFISNLLKNQTPEQQAKVQVFVRTGTHCYVHSKLYIMDDECAIIGSANCARRSLTNDSEAIAGICDEALWNITGYNFAHRLRIALWAEHLFNVNITDLQQPTDSKKLKRAELVFAELADGVASAVHWLDETRPKEAQLTRYEDPRFTSLVTAGLEGEWAWIDPDGS
jgi:phosphatidylserine/phosphatidylglycerophosphate/cardiolipin synthase-like enzyme